MSDFSNLIKYEVDYSDFITLYQEDGWYLQYSSNLFSFDYAYEKGTYSGKIREFSNEVVEKNFTLVLLEPDTELFQQKCDGFIKSISKNLARLEPGRLYFGDYYIEGYIKTSGQQTTDNRVNKAVFECIMAIEDPYWKLDTLTDTSRFPYVENSSPYDADMYIEVTSTSTPVVDFRLMESQAVSLYEYGADITLATGEILIIDTKNREIYTLLSGVKTNVYKNRYTNDKNGIYDKLPPQSYRCIVANGSAVIIVTERFNICPWYKIEEEEEVQE